MGIVNNWYSVCVLPSTTITLLQCNVCHISTRSFFIPDIVQRMLYVHILTMVTANWWECEAVFIFIVYWMMLPETLTKQHEMERQLTNGIGYGRKWSWVNLRYYINWGNPCKTHQDIQILGQDLNSGFPKYEAGMLRMWSWLFMTKFNAKIIGFNAVWEGRQK